MTPNILILFLLFIFSSTSARLLLPYGADIDFQTVSERSVGNVDDEHVVVELKTPFVINDEKFHSVFIDVNGVLSFDEPVRSFDPKDLKGPFLAPFWGDIDLTGTVTEGNTFYYRVSESDEDRNWVRFALEETSGATVSWRPKTVVVATWHRVGSFMAQTSQLNTFQVVLATDGEESYSFFNYPSDGLNWWISDQGQTSVAGFRTRNAEFLQEQSSIDAVFLLTNHTNSGRAGRQIFKLDGARPLLTKISSNSPACFFGGIPLTISGFGFVESKSLKCVFTSSQRSVETEATFVSFNEVTCDLPPWDAGQIVNISVANQGSKVSNPVGLFTSDCILSFAPVKTCIGGGLFTVESFPVLWNAEAKYSCHFGDLKTEGTVENEVLSCPLPQFTSSENVALRIGVNDRHHKADTIVKSRQFGFLKVHECSVVVNRKHECSKRTVGVLWDDGNLEENNKLYGILELPSGSQKSLTFEGKFQEFDVPENGVYTLRVSGVETSFDVSC